MSPRKPVGGNGAACWRSSPFAAVTLNDTGTIREDTIYDEATFHHPVFDLAAIAAQDTIRAINGQNRTWFCGAWMRNGFHEDGLASAYEVAQGFEAEAAMRLAAE